MRPGLEAQKVMGVAAPMRRKNCLLAMEASL